MPGIAEHRTVFLQALQECELRRLCRDVSTIETPWGRVSSRAIYRSDGGADWAMVVDEFGEPTDTGREIYSAFKAPQALRTIVRISNKNQLLLGRDSIVQLSPRSWTTRFLELSALYDLLHRLPANFPHPSSLERGEMSPFSALVELAWRGRNRHDILYGLQERSRRLDGLPVALQALLLVCDSDLGTESRPFIEIESWHPASLNRLSRWRCWVAKSAAEDVYSLLVPPVAFGGEDIYHRAIWGPTPQSRVRHLCVAEAAIDSFVGAEIHQIDYERLWNQLHETLERARRDRDPYCQLAGGIARDELLNSTLRRIEFRLKFWSHHMQEVLILGDVPLSRVFEIQMSPDLHLPSFARSSNPIWSVAESITPSDRLAYWTLPFFGADDETARADVVRARSRKRRSK